MKVKKNISLEKDILQKGMNKAKNIGMNFSVYVTYLINKDIGEIAVTIEPKKVKDSKISSAIDNIMGV